MFTPLFVSPFFCSLLLFLCHGAPPFRFSLFHGREKRGILRMYLQKPSSKGMDLGYYVNDPEFLCCSSSLAMLVGYK